MITRRDLYMAATLIQRRAQTWQKTKQLARIGRNFVERYSEDDVAELIVSPRFGDDVSYIPVDQRAYEYAFTVEKLVEHNISGKMVIDVGSAGSVLPAILSALGNRVICVDLIEWPMQWPNLEHRTGDISTDDKIIPPESADVIICISTVEHVGLGRYGDKLDRDGDLMAMTRIGGG